MRWEGGRSSFTAQMREAEQRWGEAAGGGGGSALSPRLAALYTPPVPAPISGPLAPQRSQEGERKGQWEISSLTFLLRLQNVGSRKVLPPHTTPTQSQEEEALRTKNFLESFYFCVQSESRGKK